MRRYISWLALVTLAAAPSPAQLTRAYISGTVQDATGAVITGVAIRITNLATNVKSETTTNEEGVYRFVAVEPGAHQIEFSKAGFEDRQIAPVEITSTQEAVVSETLRPAGVSTSVTVEAPPPGVGLAKATESVDFHVDGALAENMPQRDAVNLARLAPLTVQRPGGGVAAAGQHNFHNSFTVDGLEHLALIPALIPASRFLPESISELHVQSVAYSAEFGHNSGAHISAITRGGTNHFHAEAWDYYNANFLNSRNLLDKTAQIESERYVEHDAGGSAGGPVKKNRTFFFG